MNSVVFTGNIIEGNKLHNKNKEDNCCHCCGDVRRMVVLIHCQ